MRLFSSALNSVVLSGSTDEKLEGEKMNFLIIGLIVLVVLFIIIFTWSLCVAAARGDRMAEQARKELKEDKAAED